MSNCGGDGLVLPEEGAPASIEIISGNGQAGIAGTPLSQSLVVEVTDTRDRPVASAQVEFTVESGDGQVTPAAGATNAEGRVGATWTLGPGAGAQRVRARVGEASSGNLVTTFDATALSGSGALLELVSGDDQTGSVGSPLAEPLVVRVRDGLGNPVNGIEIIWTVSAGTTDPTSTLTDAEGEASVQRILGPSAGDQSAQASADGLAGSPVTFIHHAAATSAVALAFSQEPLNGAAGVSLTPAVKVSVRDGAGNIVTSSTADITLSIGNNPAGGTLSGTTTVTAVAGVATFSNLSIDKVGNGYTLVAAGGGLPQVTSAPFDIASGTSNRLVFTAQPTSQVVGGTLTPPVQVTVQDVAGNPVTSANNQITLVIGENVGGSTISPSPAQGKRGKWRGDILQSPAQPCGLGLYPGGARLGVGQCRQRSVRYHPGGNHDDDLVQVTERFFQGGTIGDGELRRRRGGARERNAFRKRHRDRWSHQLRRDGGRRQL